MKTEKRGVNGFNFVFWGAVILVIFGLVIFFSINSELLLPFLAITSAAVLVFFVFLLLGF